MDPLLCTTSMPDLLHDLLRKDFNKLYGLLSWNGNMPDLPASTTAAYPCLLGAPRLAHSQSIRITKQGQ